MKGLIEFARDEVLLPLIRRPRLLQIAALCTREREGRTEVLLVTSRGTKRWILPKGWPHKGSEGPGSALREAWEEAGVKRATVVPEPVGQYASVKRGATGLERPCEVLVFRVHVREMAEEFPESGERMREWLTPAVAAARVGEPQLKAILSALG